MTHNRPITRHFRKLIDSESSEDHFKNIVYPTSDEDSLVKTNISSTRQATSSDEEDPFNTTIIPFETTADNMANENSNHSGGSTNMSQRMLNNSLLDFRVNSLEKEVGTFENGKDDLQRFLENAEDCISPITNIDERVMFMRSLRK